MEEESWRDAEFEDAEEAIRYMAEEYGPRGSMGWYMYQVWVKE